MSAMFMGGGFFVLGILFVTIVAPIWILAHYLTSWRRTRGLSSADERSLAELWESTRRIEQRIANLERVLDAETPGWRGDDAAEGPPPPEGATSGPGVWTKGWTRGVR